MADRLPTARTVENDLTLSAMSLSLRVRRLPPWNVPAIAVAAIAIALLLNVTTGVAGVAGTCVVAVIAYLVLQTAWSLAIEGRRHTVDRLATSAVYATFLIAVIPLISVLWTVVSKGMTVLSLSFLTHSNRNVLNTEPGGGIYHALIGTFEQVLIAAMIGIPIGVLTAIYLVEYGDATVRSRNLKRSISFFVDVMTGVPSVVVGLFVYTALVLTLGFPRSGFMAAIALFILMLPVVVRSTEEMLKLVPRDLREASYALGIPKWRTILKVVLPTALPGIITGSMLAVARAAGETAPLLLVTFVTDSINFNPFDGKAGQNALPLYIWQQIGFGTDASTNRAWGAALVLILFVMILYLSAKLVGRFAGVKTR